MERIKFDKDDFVKLVSWKIITTDNWTEILLADIWYDVMLQEIVKLKENLYHKHF